MSNQQRKKKDKSKVRMGARPPEINPIEHLYFITMDENRESIAEEFKKVNLEYNDLLEHNKGEKDIKLRLGERSYTLKRRLRKHGIKEKKKSWVGLNRKIFKDENKVRRINETIAAYRCYIETKALTLDYSILVVLGSALESSNETKKTKATEILSDKGAMIDGEFKNLTSLSVREIRRLLKVERTKALKTKTFERMRDRSTKIAEDLREISEQGSALKKFDSEEKSEIKTDLLDMRSQLIESICQVDNILKTTGSTSATIDKKLIRALQMPTENSTTMN